MKTATEAAWKIRRKLTELATRGIDGERDTAARKLARLEKRFDFSKPEPGGASIFDGVFTPSGTAIFLASFPAADVNMGGLVKWSIENGAKITGIWRTAHGQTELWVEAAPESLPQLRRLVEIVRTNFADLWQRFSAAPTVKPADRQPFLLGLYDGMMSDDWPAGKPLPRSYVARTKPSRKSRRPALTVAPGMTLHPYSIALDLGRKIRFSVPIGEIAKELQSQIDRLAA